KQSSARRQARCEKQNAAAAATCIFSGALARAAGSPRRFAPRDDGGGRHLAVIASVAKQSSARRQARCGKQNAAAAATCIFSGALARAAGSPRRFAPRDDVRARRELSLFNCQTARRFFHPPLEGEGEKRVLTGYMGDRIDRRHG